MSYECMKQPVTVQVFIEVLDLLLRELVDDDKVNDIMKLIRNAIPSMYRLFLGPESVGATGLLVEVKKQNQLVEEENQPQSDKDAKGAKRKKRKREEAEVAAAAERPRKEAKYERKMEGLRASLADAEARADDLESKRQRLRDKYAALKGEKQLLTDENQRLQEENKQLEKKNKQLRRENKRLEREKAEEGDRRKERKARLRKLRDKLEAANKEVEELKSRLPAPAAAQGTDPETDSSSESDDAPLTQQTAPRPTAAKAAKPRQRKVKKRTDTIKACSVFHAFLKYAVHNLPCETRALMKTKLGKNIHGPMGAYKRSLPAGVGQSFDDTYRACLTLYNARGNTREARSKGPPLEDLMKQEDRMRGITMHPAFEGFRQWLENYEALPPPPPLPPPPEQLPPPPPQAR